MSKDIYESPLASRYASKHMLHLFSPDMRFQTWRRLWVELARAEHDLGLPITAEQVAELETHVTDIDYAAAVRINKREVIFCGVDVFYLLCVRTIINVYGCIVCPNSNCENLIGGI